MLRIVLAAFVLSVPGAAWAQDSTDSGKAPERVRSVTLQGEEKCPASTSTEVVVCSRINPDEQFRIPKQLRDPAEPAAKNQSWAKRTETAESISRVAAGLPDTCSPVGTGGQSGCALMRNQAYAAEKKAAQRAEAAIP